MDLTISQEAKQVVHKAKVAEDIVSAQKPIKWYKYNTLSKNHVLAKKPGRRVASPVPGKEWGSTNDHSGVAHAIFIARVTLYAITCSNSCERVSFYHSVALSETTRAF